MNTLNLPKEYLKMNDNSENNIEFEINCMFNGDNNKIFDSRFVNKNKDKDKCKIILYQNKEYELKEYFEDIDKNYKNREISFILRINKNIIDISYMFYECDKLLLIRNKRNINYSNNDSLHDEDEINYSIDNEKK